MSHRHRDSPDRVREVAIEGDEPELTSAPREYWELTELGREVARMFETGALDPTEPHARAVTKYPVRNRGGH